MIALRGDSTPYDLKRAIGHSVGYFWPFPHAQLYSEPERLRRGGLLTCVQEDSGRRRKVYDITPEGLEALRDWVRSPVGEPFQLRDVAELKLFFSELVDPEDVVRLGHEQIALHEARLAEYDAMLKRFGGRGDIAQRMIPLELGIALEKTALEFWRGLIHRSGHDETTESRRPPLASPDQTPSPPTLNSDRSAARPGTAQAST
jgi:DNA-binding PadR family transcriptional regulator